MKNKDKDEGLEVFPLDLLLLIFLGKASLASCVVKPSSEWCKEFHSEQSRQVVEPSRATLHTGGDSNPSATLCSS